MLIWSLIKKPFGSIIFMQNLKREAKKIKKERKEKRDDYLFCITYCKQIMKLN